MSQAKMRPIKKVGYYGDERSDTRCKYIVAGVIALLILFITLGAVVGAIALIQHRKQDTVISKEECIISITENKEENIKADTIHIDVNAFERQNDLNKTLFPTAEAIDVQSVTNKSTTGANKKLNHDRKSQTDLRGVSAQSVDPETQPTDTESGDSYSDVDYEETSTDDIFSGSKQRTRPGDS